jgi:hypothetical protein
MPLKKPPKNPQRHPNRATDDPLEAESENLRERQIPDNINRTRDMVLSPHNQSGGEDKEREAEDAVEGNFEVNLVDAGVEDEDISSLRRIEELAAKMRERTMPPNIRTRAQAEAATRNVGVKIVSLRGPNIHKRRWTSEGVPSLNPFVMFI